MRARLGRRLNGVASLGGREPAGGGRVAAGAGAGWWVVVAGGAPPSSPELSVSVSQQLASGAAQPPEAAFAQV